MVRNVSISHQLAHNPPFIHKIVRYQESIYSTSSFVVPSKQREFLTFARNVNQIAQVNKIREIPPLSTSTQTRNALPLASDLYNIKVSSYHPFTIRENRFKM